MMNKKGQNNNIAILVVIALGVLAYLYFGGYFQQVPSGGDLSPDQKGGIVNGYYDSSSGQCWIDKDHPPGVYPLGQVETSFFQCCLNQEGQQVDCNNPATLLQTGVISNPFAIYQGQPGIFSVTHGVKITNTGNVDITKAWINSATWTPSNSALSTAYSGMVGSTSTQAGAIPKASYRTFSSSPIDLQAIGGTGTPITYSLSLVTKGSATNLPDFTKTTNAQISVEKEEIGFDVVITLGA